MPDEKQDVDFITLERVFAAPPATLWRAWTEPDLFERWYKPNSTCRTSVVEHDLRVGAVMRVEMRFGEMPPHCERWEFDAIEATARLRFKQSLTDADGNIVGNPRMPDWPRVMLTTIELHKHADGTLQRLIWRPFEATEAELECFRSSSAHLDKGWVAGFDSLGRFLDELGAQ